jgi:hypothetical protein
MKKQDLNLILLTNRTIFTFLFSDKKYQGKGKDSLFAEHYIKIVFISKIKYLRLKNAKVCTLFLLSERLFMNA